MDRVRLIMKVEAGDIVHIKMNLKKALSQSKLPYNNGYSKFCGQKVLITSVSITYGEKQHIGYSFICKLANITNDKSYAHLSLDCIDRSYPLIRNGKKFSLLHKRLYIHLP
jgi:hypothetical protein